MDQALVQALRARNVDVITALDAGMIQREDADHLDFAAEQGRILCTYNIGDFYRLHGEYLAHGKPHAGIILMRQQYHSAGEQMRCILRLMASRSANEMKNWVEFLSGWR